MLRRSIRCCLPLVLLCSALLLPATAGAVSYSARFVAPGGNSDAWINDAGDIATAGRGLFLHNGTVLQPPANTHLVGIRADGAAFYEDLPNRLYGWLLPSGATLPVDLPPYTPTPTELYYFDVRAVSGSGFVAGTTYWGGQGGNVRELHSWSAPQGGGPPTLKYTLPRIDPPTQVLEVLGVTDDGRVASSSVVNSGGTSTALGVLDATPTGACAVVAASDAGALVQVPQPCQGNPHYVVSTDGVLANGVDIGLGWGRPFAVSDRGQVVGQLEGNADPVDHLGHALLFSGGATVFLDNAVPNGATLRFYQGYDVNNRGQILVAGKEGLYVISTTQVMTGVLVDGAGLPVPNAPVTIVDVTGGGEPREARAMRDVAAATDRQTVRTDAKGRISVEVAPGSYRIELGKGCAGATVGGKCAHELTVEVGVDAPPVIKARLDARGAAAALPGKIGQRLVPAAGAIVVSVRCRRVTGPCKGQAVVRGGGKVLAQGKLNVLPARTARIRLTLTAAGKALHGSTSATLTALGASRKVVVAAPAR